MPSPIEFITEFAAIVDFTIKHNPRRAAVIRHGLMAACHIDNAQPACGQSHVPESIHSIVVRSPIRGNVDHALQEPVLDPPLRVEIEDATNATHMSVWKLRLELTKE